MLINFTRLINVSMASLVGFPAKDSASVFQYTAKLFSLKSCIRALV
jgi:hypothetical protein